MKLNTNSNTYTILYACGVVIVVAFLLAFVSSSLKGTIDKNVELDKKKQILISLGVVNPTDAEAEYDKLVKADIIVNAKGETIKSKGGFLVDRKDMNENNLPVYICEVEGKRKYVLPMVGKGLWGTIWGYVAINNDCNTVHGVYMSHESETAGLGAIISERGFQEKFIGKSVADSTGSLLSVMKFTGKNPDSPIQCDGISGATLTCNGVTDMLHTYLKYYTEYLNKEKNKK